jgi:hypothetical protein
MSDVMNVADEMVKAVNGFPLDIIEMTSTMMMSGPTLSDACSQSRH